MAGPSYVASATLTTTALQSLAADNSTGYPLSGWFSETFTNTTNKYIDYVLAGKFETHASNRQAGYIYVYLIPSLNDTPLWPASATGTVGTQGAGSFVDTEERDSACILLDAIVVDTTASSIVYLKPKSIVSAMGGLIMPPTHFSFFVSTNAVTTTAAALAATGNALYMTALSAP